MISSAYQSDSGLVAGKTRTLLDLIRLDGQVFCQSLRTLDNLIAASHHAMEGDVVNQELVALELQRMPELLILLQQIGLKMSAIQLRKFVEIEAVAEGMKLDGSYYSSIKRIALESRTRIIEEIDLVHLFAVRNDNLRYIEDGAKLFGDQVGYNFPKITADLDEAALCLGMERNTACVFHLMRAMETVVRTLGGKLNVTLMNKHQKSLTWGQVTEQMQTKVDGLPADQKRPWLDVMASLNSVRLAWRNDTMHPDRSYSDSDAKLIFENVRSFMIVASQIMAV